MKINQELLDVLLKIGLTEEDVAELAARLSTNADSFKQAREQAEKALEHNATVAEGLHSTIAYSQAKEDRARSLLSKITVQEEE